MELKPVWEIVGMDWYSFRHLPWEKKKVLIRRAYGIRINDTCAGCGHRLDVMKERNRLAALPEKLRNNPYGLLQAYFEHNAEDFTILNKYPHAVLTCGHKGERS